MAGTLRSSAGVSLAVLASRVLGVVRDALFAALFGVSRLTDAYVVAFRIPNLLRDLFAEGALSSAFVPAFAQAMSQGGKERAFRLGNLMLTGVVVVTGAIAVLGIVYVEDIVGLMGVGGTKLADTMLLARVMMPVLVLVSASAVWMGMLNAQERFLAPAYAPAVFNTTSILCAVALVAAALEQRTAMVLFSGATTLSALMQAMAQLPSLWRLGYRPRLLLAGITRDPDVRRIVRLMAPATIGLAAVQINVFVNTYFAVSLGDGPATYLQNAFRLFYLPIGVFGVALATVTTARMSTDAARGDRAALRARVAEGLRGVWLLALPSAVGMIVLAEPIVAVLFERGKFSHADTLSTVPIVRAYMVGVLPFSLVKVFAPAFFALDRSRVPVVCSVLSVGANLLFSVLFYRSLGASGLALGTSVAALVNLAGLRLAFARIVGPPHEPGVVRGVLRFVAANLVLAGVVGALWSGGSLVLDAMMATGRASAFAIGGARAGFLFATIGVGCLAYVAAARALGCPGAEGLATAPGRILARLRRR